MSTNKIVCLVALLLASPAALAAPKFSCVSADELDKRTEECRDNHHYTKAGQDCLQKLEALLKSGGAKDREKFLATAKIAKGYISSYRDNIYYPEDWDAPEELIGDPVDFLDSQKCYAEARDSLKKAEETIDHYISDYGRGRARQEKK